MNHDELLAEIKSLNDSCSVSSRLGNALKAVVELHKPFISEGKETKFCDGCEQCWACREWGSSDYCPCDKYPCPTIQAIEKELM